jgi:hypothetical protein
MQQNINRVVAIFSLSFNNGNPPHNTIPTAALQPKARICTSSTAAREVKRVLVSHLK